MTGFSSELFRRRVPQILFLYLGAAWVALEFTDWLTTRYLLSTELVDMVLLGMVSLVPAVLLLAWSHGAPGKDRWTRAEKIGVPLNLLVTAGLLFSLFHGKELGAAAEEVTVIDEQGQAMEVLVPKPAFRRKVAVFFFDNEGVYPEDDWLQYGIAQLLETDLKQDSFIGVWSPWGGFQGSNFALIRRAGYEDGTGVPASLLEKVSEEFYQQFFVTGQFTRQGEDYVIDAQLYSVDPARLISEREVRGVDPMRLVDLLSSEIQKEIVVVEGSERINPDLPVAEVLTGSLDALRDFVKARVAMLLHNDQETAIEHFRKAVEADPSFALAHALLAQVYMLSGNTSAALEVNRQALQHDYKLLADTRFTVKSLDYLLRGQVDKVLPVLEMWVELEPDNAEAHAALGINYLFLGNQRDKAMASFDRALELGEDWVLMWQARVHMTNGDIDRALAAYRRHAESFPEDHGPWVFMGQLYKRIGDLEKAREASERAALLGSSFVTPLVDLADLDLRTGRLEEAWLNLEKAMDVARDDSQMAVVTAAIAGWHDAQGQMKLAAEAMDRYLEYQRRILNPVNFMATVALESDHYARAGRADEILTRLDSFEDQIQPPYDRFLDLGHLKVYLESRQPDLAEERLLRVEEFIREMRREDYAFAIALSRGVIAYQRGDLAGARAQLEEALVQFETSIQSTFEDAEDHLWLIVRLSDIAREQGDLEAAEAYLEDALTIWPWHGPANLSLARLRLETGRADEAREALERALYMWENADPGYTPAAEARELYRPL